ncbi:DNA-binding NarL/FixJ family response regulator [Actinoplanes octamycinicus]|uniref:DNA-binding NarL/FixJ family response regulator n=1 Tax=Actinoplanes octamycinicus TaxID=135948 RepID=A0A7W7H0B0_9ACTN|nr:hypothetical protein [Actinoplanes octamycinicus]MBB4741568.1 DNA-binding NarL/FixJ family response regulator [Actinoplanes octamycinicus]GIE57119.1 hypothetical protein Aoc01nite_25210 [Actinoplanes octamycinicus]
MSIRPTEPPLHDPAPFLQLLTLPAGAGPAVIVLTTVEDHDLVARAIRAGAIGYPLKHAPPASPSPCRP